MPRTPVTAADAEVSKEVARGAQPTAHASVTPSEVARGAQPTAHASVTPSVGVAYGNVPHAALQAGAGRDRSESSPALSRGRSHGTFHRQ